MEQQQVLTQEQINVRQQQLIKYFMKKKGIGHLEENLKKNIANLAEAMKQEGVTEADIRAGRATENVFKLLEKLNASKIVAEGVLAHQWNKASVEEIEQIQNEAEGYEAQEQKKETSSKEVSEALEKFQENPTSTNQLNYFKKAMGNLDPAEKFAKEDTERAEAHKRAFREIRQKTIEKNAREEAQKQINLQRLQNKDSLHDRERKEALEDERINTNPNRKSIKPPASALDGAIKARTEEILENEYK